MSAGEPALRMLLLLLPAPPPAWAHHGLDSTLCRHTSSSSVIAMEESEKTQGIRRYQVSGTAGLRAFGAGHAALPDRPGQPATAHTCTAEPPA